MSKSLGNVVDPCDVAAMYGVDAARYFLLREGGIANDGDFTMDKMVERVNADLANTFGNLASRVTGAKIMPELVVPRPPEEWLDAHVNVKAETKGDVDTTSKYGETDEDLKFYATMNELGNTVDEYYRTFAFPAAIKTIMAVLNEANAYFQRHTPWKLRKVIG